MMSEPAFFRVYPVIARWGDTAGHFAVLAIAYSLLDHDQLNLNRAAARDHSKVRCLMAWARPFGGSTLAITLDHAAAGRAISRRKRSWM